MFGKPGRPREDGFVRRREIYSAVAPLIEKVGPKGGRLCTRSATFRAGSEAQMLCAPESVPLRPAALRKSWIADGTDT